MNAKQRHTSLIAAAALALAVSPLLANDWTQWRGTERIGVWSETGIVEELPDQLKISWRVAIKSGFSGPVVADGRVFVTDWEEDPESRTMDGTERGEHLADGGR